MKQIMDTKTKQIDFDKMIKQMSKLSPKIELMLILQRNAIRVHKTVAVYADTESNIHLTHEERVKMDTEQLRQTNLAASDRQ